MADLVFDGREHAEFIERIVAASTAAADTTAAELPSDLVSRPRPRLSRAARPRPSGSLRRSGAGCHEPAPSAGADAPRTAENALA